MTPRRFLLVDDDSDLLAATTAHLQHLGHRVAASCCVSGAIEMLCEEQFDIVITEMVIGGRDGAEVIKTAKAMQRAARIVATTGAATHSSDAAVALGVGVPIAKPFTLDQLMGVVGA